MNLKHLILLFICLKSSVFANKEVELLKEQINLLKSELKSQKEYFIKEIKEIKNQALLNSDEFNLEINDFIPKNRKLHIKHIKA